MTIFEGSAVALVLPMFDNGDIDFEGFKRQVQRMVVYKLYLLMEQQVKQLQLLLKMNLNY